MSRQEGAPHIQSTIIKDSDGITFHELTYGGKRLRVEISSPTYSAATFLENTGKTKSPGATTALYTEARILIENRATLLDTPFVYVLETSWDSMRAWALASGNKIFHWDSVRDRSVSDQFKLVACATIFPRLS